MIEPNPTYSIETCTFSFLGPILRSYSTFNRDIHKIYQPIRLIESILIIETQEYLAELRNGDDRVEASSTGSPEGLQQTNCGKSHGTRSGFTATPNPEF